MQSDSIIYNFILLFSSPLNPIVFFKWMQCFFCALLNTNLHANQWQFILSTEVNLHVYVTTSDKVWYYQKLTNNISFFKRYRQFEMNTWPSSNDSWNHRQMTKLFCSHWLVSNQTFTKTLKSNKNNPMWQIWSTNLVRALVKRRRKKHFFFIFICRTWF